MMCVQIAWDGNRLTSSASAGLSAVPDVQKCQWGSLIVSTGSGLALSSWGRGSASAEL